MINRPESAINLSNYFKKLVVEFIKPTAFYEIGAFDAETSIFIKQNHTRCNVFAFEANPYNFEKFKNNLNIDDIFYIHCAISNEIGSTIFNIQNKKKSKELPPIRGNNSLFERNEKGVQYEKILVPVDTIDNYFPSLEESVCLWIDVEGKGYEVLCGASRTLKNVKLILIEVESKQFWKEQKLDSDIITLLEIYNFIPIARDFENQYQYNILFCKEDEVSNVQLLKLTSSFRKEIL